MKKIIVLSAISASVLIACNNNPLKPDKSKAVASHFKPSDSIPGTVARDMVTHYLDTSLVDHHLDAIIKQVSLSNSDLFEIFKLSTSNHPITRIRLLAAAYLNTDPNVARRNKVTVLLQIKQGYSSDYYYYDVQSGSFGGLCPPPVGCSTEQ